MKTIYFDADDVLVHFNQYVNETLGTSYKIGEVLKYSDWEELRRNHQRMFADMLPNQDTLYVCNRLNPALCKVRVLTAIPLDEHSPWQYATMDKVNWFRVNAPGIPVFIGPYAHDKHRHCKHGDLLIDDKRSNCEEWVAAGGIAHLFTGDVEAMKQFIDDNLGEE
jgi:FMN phosphatase YigB (HAD superfamily)